MSQQTPQSTARRVVLCALVLVLCCFHKFRVSFWLCVQKLIYHIIIMCIYSYILFIIIISMCIYIYIKNDKYSKYNFLYFVFFLNIWIFI